MYAAQSRAERSRADPEHAKTRWNENDTCMPHQLTAPSYFPNLSAEFSNVCSSCQAKFSRSCGTRWTLSMASLMCTYSALSRQCHGCDSEHSLHVYHEVCACDGGIYGQGTTDGARGIHR